LARKARAKEIDGSDARRAIMALDRHVRSDAIRMVSIISQDFEQATEWIMAMRHPLRVPDALHLAVAARRDAAFWTLDHRLASTAKWVGLTTHK
jgi:predicted nucleic acid-binding protein